MLFAAMIAVAMRYGDSTVVAPRGVKLRLRAAQQQRERLHLDGLRHRHFVRAPLSSWTRATERTQNYSSNEFSSVTNQGHEASPRRGLGRGDAVLPFPPSTIPCREPSPRRRATPSFSHTPVYTCCIVDIAAGSCPLPTRYGPQLLSECSPHQPFLTPLTTSPAFFPT